jgi:hypothetical protein
MPTHLRGRRELAFRLLVAAGLLIDAAVHAHLSGRYQQAQPGGIGEGTLFAVEAASAVGAAAYLLLRHSRPAYLLAALVGIGGLAVLLLYRYFSLPAFGPIPAMYEPIWYPEKVLSAAAEGVAGFLAAVAAVLLGGGEPSVSRGWRTAPGTRRRPPG